MNKPKLKIMTKIVLVFLAVLFFSGNVLAVTGDLDDWYAVCSKSDESITLTKSPNPVTHITLKGPFANEPAARQWVNANYPNWYCAGATGQRGDWYVLCDNQDFSVTLSRQQPTTTGKRVLSGPFPSEPQARNWVNNNYPNWNCRPGSQRTGGGGGQAGQVPPPPGGQPGGLWNPLPNCPFEIYAAGLRFGWAWSMARWNLGLPAVVTHLTWAGVHMRNANFICSTTPQAWSAWRAHVSAINSFVNQMGRGNMTDLQIQNRLHSFSGFSTALACQVIASRLECQKETCAWHYFLIGYYLARAQVAMQVLDNPGTPPEMVRRARQEASSSLSIVIRRIQRLPQLGWPGFAWRCRNLSGALPLLRAALTSVNAQNTNNRAVPVTQSVTLIANVLSASLGSGQSIVFAIDLSGSMAGSPQGSGGQNKLEIAKQAAINALTQLPQGAEAAIVSFGASSCTVKLEIGFTKDRQALAAKIQTLSGSGSTPIAQALYFARDYILKAGMAGRASIILLSDGMESCKGNPVQAAKIIKSQLAGRTITQKPVSQPSLIGLAYAAEPFQTGTAQPASGFMTTTADAGLSPDPAPSPVTLEDLLGGQQVAPEVPTLLDESSVQPPDPAPGPSETQNGPVQVSQPGGSTQVGGGPSSISIHTIGLGLDPNSQAQRMLNQIASAGGGQSFSAQNLSSLQQAFTSAITSSPGGGGGGGGGGLIMSQPGVDWPLILLIFLMAGCVVILIGILVIRSRGAGVSARIFARIDVFYSDGGRKSFEIRTGLTSIGRGRENMLILNDPDVSTRHAEIFLSQNNFYLRDLGSMNGTVLNGSKITEAPLFANDEITIGTTRLVFIR